MTFVIKIKTIERSKINFQGLMNAKFHGEIGYFFLKIRADFVGVSNENS